MTMQWLLPTELVHYILRMLAPRDMLALARTCKLYTVLRTEPVFAQHALQMAAQLEGYRNIFRHKFELHFQVDTNDMDDYTNYLARGVESDGIGIRVDTNANNVDHVSLVRVADLFLCNRLQTVLEYARQFTKVCVTLTLAQCVVFAISQVEQTDTCYVFRIQFVKGPWDAELAETYADVRRFQRAEHLRIYKSAYTC